MMADDESLLKGKPALVAKVKNELVFHSLQGTSNSCACGNLSFGGLLCPGYLIVFYALCEEVPSVFRRLF
jgi:hypothetical protein